MRFLSLTIILSVMSGAMALGHGTHGERVEFYSEKLQRDPSDVNARHELALAHLENGDWQLALSELRLADRLRKPDSGLDFSVTRARALVLGGRLDSAREVLDAFLKKSPDHAAALLERARILARLKKPQQSLADYRKALKFTANPEPDFFLEMADQLVAQHANDEAIALIQQSIEMKGQVPSLVLKAMDLEIAVGRYDDALKRVDAMAKRMPRLEPWLAKRASVLAQAGRLDESKHQWQALLDRLQSLPNLERSSVAMATLATEASQALSAFSAQNTGIISTLPSNNATIPR